jgi:hypothetical protein
MTKQQQALQLLDQLIVAAKIVDDASKVSGEQYSESFQTFHLKILRETLLEIFNDKNGGFSLNSSMLDYGPEESTAIA